MRRPVSSIRQYAGAAFLSLTLHAAVIGAVWVGRRTLVVGEEDPPPEPLYFELVDETAPESSPVVESPKPPPKRAVIEEVVPVKSPDSLPILEPEPKIEAKVDSAQEETTAIVEDLPETEHVQSPPDAVRSDSADEIAEQEQAKVISAPQALNRISPRYPRSARRNRREGAVTVEFEVGADGRVTSVSVVVSSGHRDLDEAALEAARTAMFAPATEDGVSVAAIARLTFEFRLK